MTDFKPTEEQQDIEDAAALETYNMLVRARAGAAKTSTLVLIAKRLKKVPILCLAFNKKIAVEMTERLPSMCVAQTLNATGHRAWAQQTGKRLQLKTNKNYQNVKALIDNLKGNEKDEAYYSFSDIIRAVDSGKTAGYIPDHHYDRASPLMGDDEFFAWLEEEPTPLMERLIRQATLDSLEQSFQGAIDFNDQILMTSVFPVTFPQYPLVLVDEAQDLSALNHAMLRKLAKKRIIAVGDECQAIYGFRGAHEDSMELLREQFDMREFSLTISFRCPNNVVLEANWRAPDMRSPDWAKPGEVKRFGEWSVDDVDQNTAIICRNNAPLFSMALRLLKDGKYPELYGNDIGKQLIKIMRSFSKEDDMPREEVREAIEDWERIKASKSRNPDKISDMAECMHIFADHGETLGESIARAEHIMNASGSIKLMTGHKSKGLEFPRVIFLDQHLVRTDQGQDRNLKYVIQTRAQDTLIYANSVDYQSQELLAEEKEEEVA